MKKLICELWNGKYGHIVRYLVVGGLTTFVSLASFQVLCILFGVDPEAPDNVYVTVSNIISIILAILFAYTANKLVVFRARCDSKQSLLAEFITFVSGRIFTMIVEVVLVFLFVNVIGQYPLLGKFETSVVIVILNYLISRFIVFRHKKGV